MKAFLLNLLLLLVFTSSILFSQESPTSKGVYRLYGSISGSYTKTKEGVSEIQMHEVKMLDLTFSPGASYLVSDNFELGLQISYYHYNRSYTGGYLKEFSINNHYFFIGPNFRVYLPVKEVYPFFGGVLSFGIPSKYGDLINNFDLNNIQVIAGLDYYLSKNVALEPLLSYTWDNTPLGSTKIMVGIGINYSIF
ncbi:MAG: hypothetical protein ACM3Q2_10455 [Syntrophothermus sp.]